jgi:hypothetical protein
MYFIQSYVYFKTHLNPLLSPEVVRVYCPVYRGLSRHSRTHKHREQIRCHNTDYIHANGHDRTITVILAKHCKKLPDDGFLVIGNMLEHFKYF